MKVVKSGYKIDLHIHSVYSRGKDKGKVSYNTLENIGTLIEKLNKNGVQMCAVTDHDTFNYDIYSKLKLSESDMITSIAKVFPGVEFSVEFHGDDGDSVIHVIAVFNDDDEEKVSTISTHLTNKDGTICYDRDMAFSEEKFLSILRNIDIDTVLIAHQKGTLSSRTAKKNDALCVGKERFQEFVFTEYFEAFEFKNRKNEVFNKSYLNVHNMSDDIRFLTGSDCHDWRYYPKETEKDTVDFTYSYLKCLPNFRGLVMAITDHRRIKTVNSFFNPTETYTPEMQMTLDGVEYKVPLSRGINVIIGDNSIGKSLLLHKLTGYSKKQEGLLKPTVANGYAKYLKKNNVAINTEIPAAEVFAFDMQGEVRDKFEQEKIKSDDFLRAYYPAAIRADSYKEKVQRYLKKIYDYLEEKFAIELKEAQLGRFLIIDEDCSNAESLTFIGSIARNNKQVEGYSGFSSDIDAIIEKLDTLRESQWIDQLDRVKIVNIIDQLDDLSQKYDKKKKTAEFEITKIGLFQAVVNNFKQKYQASVSDSQKKLSAYNENIMAAAEAIRDLIARRGSNKVPEINLKKETIGINTYRVYDYEFNSRLGILEIDADYIARLLSGILKKETKTSVYEMSQSELADALPYFQGTPAEALIELKGRVQRKIDEDFTNKFTITQAGADRTQELSAGFNSKIYFDILSYETSHSGVYIIDQPEDNISQKSIREYLLDRFKVMGENRQVIIVTHNPQFIVNLDVDNVIFIGKQDGVLFVQSGALEYKNNDYSILDIVSTNIEGGLDTLKRRWKRYEKSSAI